MHADTNVFVDYLRSQAIAKKFLEKNSGKLSVSVVVKFELIDDTSSKGETRTIQKALILFEIVTVQIDEDISSSAENIFKNFRHSHSVSTNDSVIATSAIIRNEKLVTRKIKHFNFIP